MLNPEPLTHPDSDERLLVDELYERILSDAFRDARVPVSRMRILHTIVCAESRIDMSVLADLTNTDQDTVKRVVESLHAVLFISPKDGCVYWYHASFPDFVFSEARARNNISLHRNYPTPHVIDVTDATNFFAGSPASKSTPHLYISALSMWNQDSPVWRNWRNRFGSIPSISLPRDTTKPLLTIPTADWVLSVAFSPDGNRIVSGSYGKSVRVWGANTDEQLKEMQGHSSAVTSVAFSLDGNLIISGSPDNSVRVWDAKTGEQLREL